MPAEGTLDLDRPPHIVVVAGGDPVPAELVADAGTGALVVAADAGVARARAMGWVVDVAVGDFDSLPADQVAELDELAGEVRRHPVDKDATDLELALDVAAEAAGAAGRRVLVVGIEGGRPDHALANLLLAAADPYAPLEIELVLHRARAWVVHDRLSGRLGPGALVSLVPAHGPATVSIAGVRWPLERSTLSAGSTRGVSNECLDAPLSLTVHDGTVLCIAPRPTEEP